MADSIPSTVVGSSPIFFPLMPNWAQTPIINLTLPRDMVSYPGTSQIMNVTTDYTPIEFTLNFMIDNKADEYELLEWIHAVKGKAKRFWIEHPVHLFDLKAEVASGASSLGVIPNEFTKIGMDDERIFIAMKNGDLIVRTVTDSAYDSGTDEIVLTIDVATDRIIGVDDYWLIGRFLLCRLKEDNVRQIIQTTNVTTYAIGFTELPYENDEQGDS